MDTKNALIEDILPSLDKYVGLGSRTSIDGIRRMLKINPTRIPNDTNTPISLALGNRCDNKDKKLTIVVSPARRIGIPTFRMVLFNIWSLGPFGSTLEYSK